MSVIFRSFVEIFIRVQVGIGILIGCGVVVVVHDEHQLDEEHEAQAKFARMQKKPVLKNGGALDP